MPTIRLHLSLFFIVAAAHAQENWQQITTPSMPTARSRTGLAYDSDRHRSVLFSGFPVSGPSAADTWEYDGSWHQIAVSGPSTRYGHGLAYDPIRHRVVLFSGQDPNTSLDRDTWEYDGSSWSLRNMIAVNQQRHDMAMAFDPVRGQVIRFGGYAPAGPVGDTWAWEAPSGCSCPWGDPMPATCTRWQATPCATRSSCSAATGRSAAPR